MTEALIMINLPIYYFSKIIEKTPFETFVEINQ